MKFFRVFVIIFFAFIICHLSFVIPVSAQVPNPPVKCKDTGNPEFHSLRPYQTSTTCQSTVDNYAKFCGNELTLKETITQPYVPGDPNCKLVDGKIVCTYEISVRPHTTTINLSDANLPIMGNTEEVTNYKGEADQLNDAQKVNEYVSWYLNGVIGRAEYPFLAEDNPADTAKLVNYSGPINKLLPQETQQQLRAQTIKNAAVTRHNQIIGCTYGIPVLGHEIGGIPGPCYEKGLISWFTQAHRLSEWKNHLPPVRSDYKDFTDYQKKYQEWRGKICFEIKVPDFIPVIGGMKLLLCGENPLSPNYYSNLYSYIPLSSTEDLKGGVAIDAVSSATDPNSAGVTIKNVAFSNQKPADLFFAHLEESPELASLLQDTYAFKGADKSGPPTDVASGDTCKTVEVRTNKGDSLFAGQIRGDLSYDAKFSCDFEAPPATPSTQTCEKDVYIGLSTTSSSPNADEVWSRLVAGPSAVFKRIFPKINTAGSVGTILDMPGATKISYQGKGVSADTELRLPHFGGISEYFLKGIQTILRPKGYGEKISFGENSGEIEGKCKQDVPDSAVPAKYLGAFKSNFINLADKWSIKCPGPANNLAEECYNYVVTESAIKGINPAFALTIWLNESDASNYCDGGDTTQDFGVNIPALYKNLVGQLNKFSELPDAFSYCKNVPGFIEPMHAFLSRFQSSSGSCNPSDPVGTQYYIDVRDTAWLWVSHCTKNGRFGISWPTDNSCP